LGDCESESRAAVISVAGLVESCESVEHSFARWLEAYRYDEAPRTGDERPTRIVG